MSLLAATQIPKPADEQALDVHPSCFGAVF